MKREDQKRNKKLEKYISLLMKECPKRYRQQKLKKKDYMLWTTRGNMIYEIMPNAGIREEDLKPVMSFHVGFKPLWIDELLWDILGMESNKREPDSLKVIGAFTVWPAKKNIEIVELLSENEEYMQSVFYEKLDEILASIKEYNEDKYVDYLNTTECVDEYDKILVAIHRGDKDRAEKLLESINDDGRFSNEGKTYKEWLFEYLNREQML